MGKVSLVIMGGLLCAMSLCACVKPIDIWFFGRGITIKGEFENPLDKAPYVVRLIDGIEAELDEQLGPEPKITVAITDTITVMVKNGEDYNEIEWFGGEVKDMPLATGDTYTVGEDHAGKDIIQQAAMAGSYSITAVGDNEFSTLFHIVVRN